MTFRGAYRFASAAELEAAIAAVQELVDAEADELALALQRKGCELRVDLATTCARTTYLAYEALIETLATFAATGEVIGEIDDTLTTYGALCDRPSSHAATVAGALAWIPLLASDPLLELVRA